MKLINLKYSATSKKLVEFKEMFKIYIKDIRKSIQKTMLILKSFKKDMCHFFFKKNL